MAPENFCAIDFGTSNSAIALPQADSVQLVELEGGHRTMPTALFYAVENLAPHEAPQQHLGRAAVAAYVEGIEGRLMRSMKSILGSSLATQSTDLGAGRSVAYLDVIGHYLGHLKARAEKEAQQTLARVVLGRPVFFVDDDAVRDAAAQATLAQAAKQAGARHCIAVSSVGATARSGNFYLRTKGEVEDGLDRIGFDRLDILRPGLLAGERRGSKRPGERLGMMLAPLTNLLTPRSFDRYRAIAASVVAAALLALIEAQPLGQYIHHNREMIALVD